MAMGSAPRPSSDGGDDGHYAPVAEINVTPMVDVMLVLLVIFMVAAPLLTVGVPITLPKTKAATVTQPHEPIILSVDRTGQTFLGEEAIAADQLPTRLQTMATKDAGRIVYVRGDRTLSYGQMMTMLGVVSRAGFEKVSLLAEADGH